MNFIHKTHRTPLELFLNQKIDKVSHVQEKKLPVHFQYMTGSRSELFLVLVEKGILDPFGKITENFAQRPLPALTSEELDCVKTELTREFEIPVDGSILRLTMNRLVEAFSSHVEESKPDIRITSSQIIGGYVSYVLFSQTQYVQRVFKELDLDFEEGFFCQVGQKPSDIDLRMHVESSKGIQKKDLESLKDFILHQLAEWLPEKVEKQICSEAFNTLCTIDTGFNLMQLVSLKNSSVDWIIFNRLVRHCVFTIDNLYLPFPDPHSKQTLSPQSHQGSSLESFLHYVLGFIDAANIRTIDDRGWLRYLSWITRGNCCIYLPQQESDPYLEPALFSIFSRIHTAKHTHLPIEKIEYELEKWIHKHHPDEPLATLIYTLNMCVHLQGRLSEKEVQILLKNQLAKSSFSDEDSLIGLIKSLVCEQDVSHKTLISLLKIVAFQAYSQKSSAVEIRTDAFVRPLLHLQIDSYTLQLDFQIIEAIHDLPDKLQPEFSKLFFHICPPQSEYREYDHAELTTWGVDLEELTLSAHTLLESDDPFMRYVGLKLLFSHPTLDPKEKKDFAEKHLISTLELAEDKEAVWHEFNMFIGDLPPLGEAFMQKWVETLFEWGRGSEAFAYELWKQLPTSPASWTLIQRLASQQPSYALRLFGKMDLEAFPNEAFECIINCCCLTSSVSSHEREQLLEYMAKKLPSLLETGQVTKSKTRELSKALFTFVQRWQLMSVARIGLKQNYFHKAEKKACKELLKQEAHQALSDKLIEAFNQNPKSGSEIKALLNQGINEKILNQDEQLKFILNFYNCFPSEKNVFINTFEKLIKNEHLLNQFPCYLKEIYEFCYRRELIFPNSLNEETDVAIKAKLTLIEELVNKDFSRSYSLFQQLVLVFEKGNKGKQRFMPNREHFYTVFGALSIQLRKTHSPLDLPLLDRITHIDPNPLYDAFLDPILDICTKMLESDQETFLNWLGATKFFEALKERNKLKKLIKKAFIKAVESAQDSVQRRIEVLRKMITHYPDDLHDIDLVTWNNFNSLFQFAGTKYLVEVYYFIEEYKLIDEKEPIFITLYVTVLEEIVNRKDQTSLSKLINEPEKFKKICTATEEYIDSHQLRTSDEGRQLILRAYQYFIEAAALCHSQSRIDSIREIYSEGKQKLEKAIKTAKNLEILIRIRISMDFSFIYFLYKTKQLTNAKQELKAILAKPRGRRYWLQVSQEIDFFASNNDVSLLQRDLNQILGLIDTNIKDVVPSLLKSESKENYYYASLYLWTVILIGLWEHDKENLALFYRIMYLFFENKMDVEANQLLDFIYNHQSSFEKKCGKLASSIILEMHILFLCLKPEKPPVLAGLLTQLLQILGKKRNRQCLLTLSYGLITLSRMGEHLSLFDEFMKKRLSLTPETCFNMKSQLIQMMIKALKPDHPFAEKLSAKIGDCIAYLEKDPDFKEKEEAFSLLKHAHQEALDRLSSSS